MAYYSVLEVTPTDPNWGAAYVAESGPILAKYGGKYLARTSQHERLEGQGDNAALRIIIEWPSKEAALGFMQDPGYVPHLNARTQGSVSHHFLIAGVDDVAG